MAPKATILFNKGVQGITMFTSGGGINIRANRGNIVLEAIGAGGVNIKGKTNIDGSLTVKGDLNITGELYVNGKKIA